MKASKQYIIVVLVLYIFSVIWINRSAYLTPFDHIYWKDKYDQSQWKLPLSNRIIGDDGVYVYEGYRLSKGENPTLYNAEVPPLGKYFIGFCIALFNNGNLYGIISTLFFLFSFYLFSGFFFTSKKLRLLSTLFITLDPLVTNQISLTMLDALQAGFALLTFLCIGKTAQSKTKREQLMASTYAGITLGLFMSIKIPVLAPLYALIFLFAIYPKKYRFVSILLFFSCVAVVYLLPYIQFFLLHHTFFEWMGVQKWMLSFYRHSQTNNRIGNIFFITLFNRFINTVDQSAIQVTEWTPLWTLGMVLVLVSCFRALYKKKANDATQTLHVFFVLGFVCIYSLIPFWPRYLLLMLPFLYITITNSVTYIKNQKTRTTLFILFILIQTLFSIRLLFPTPKDMIRQFTYDWKNGFFRDMYEQLSSDSKNLSRDEFFTLGKTYLYDAQIEHIDIEPDVSGVSRFSKNQSVRVFVTYYTRHLGSFTQITHLPIIKEHGTWKIKWSWDNFITDLQPEFQLKTTVNATTRGSIINTDKKLLARDEKSDLVWITPNQINTLKEEDTLLFLGFLIGDKLSPIQIHHRYVFNTLPDKPIPIGVIRTGLSHEQEKTLKNISGISLTPNYVRVSSPSAVWNIGEVDNTLFFESHSFLYSTTSYDGISGLEKENNNTLKGFNGGSLQILDKEKNIIRTIIEKEKINGKNIRL